MKPSVEEAYYSGMIDFEQICEKLLVENEFFFMPGQVELIQRRILDEAQRRFEEKVDGTR